MDTIDIITGCDSGMGHDLADIYNKERRKVIISYLTENPFKNSSNIIAFKMDIRSEDQIINFANEILDYMNNNSLQPGTLFQNIAIGLGGTVENTPMEIYRESMEVNFFGLISLTQKLLPTIISAKGRILIHGSMGGRVSLPFFSPYSATKFALEALTDSLRVELKPFYVQVCILETGGVATPIWPKVEKQDLSFIHERYDKCVKEFLRNFVAPSKKGLSSKTASRRIYNLISRERLPYRYRISNNSFVNYLPIIIPDRLLDWILKKKLNMKY